jgi:hypothetical protein
VNILKTRIKIFNYTMILRVVLFVNIVVLILGSIFGISAFAGNNTFICSSVVENVTIDANVLVTDNETCSFRFSTINGNIDIGEGSDLEIFESVVNGNIKSKVAREVGIQDCQINGNLILDNARRLDMSNCNINGNLSFVQGMTIDLDDFGEISGNVLLKKNHFVDFDEYLVKRNVFMTGNTIVFFDGDSTIEKNVKIDGNEIVIISDRNGPVQIQKNLKITNNIEVAMNEIIVRGIATCFNNEVLTGEKNTYNGKNRGCP